MLAPGDAWQIAGLMLAHGCSSTRKTVHAGFFVCKLKKMSNTKRDVAAEGADGQAEPEDAADAPGVPDHDGTPSKLFPTAKGDKSAKRKGERRRKGCRIPQFGMRGCSVCPSLPSRLRG